MLCPGAWYFVNAIAPLVCIKNDDYRLKSELIGLFLCCSGVSTLIQTTVGLRYNLQTQLVTIFTVYARMHH